MKRLSSFAVLNIDGGDRVSYTYTEVDPATGEMISDNNKGSFFVVDDGLAAHIEAVRDYVRTRKLSD